MMMNLQRALLDHFSHNRFTEEELSAARRECACGLFGLKWQQAEGNDDAVT
jgi:hypothetical protein